MDESIYRMSLSECFLVLIIIGLWLFAVINLARKLERICNPPSIFPNYITYNKSNLNTSIHHEHYPNNSIEFSKPSHIHFIRATSEPAIDATPRTTIDIRSPSETCLYNKSSLSQQMLSPSILELGRTRSSLDLLNNKIQNRIETISSQKLLNPQRIPSIVRRSLLDLHRRALFSNSIPNNSLTRSFITTNENRTFITTTKISLIKKKYRRENAIDEDDYHKDSQSND